MIRILGKSSSINVRKVLWLCVELGVSFDQEEWGSGHRSTQEPGFLALNPNAMVPVLLDYYERLCERPGFRLHGANGMP